MFGRGGGRIGRRAYNEYGDEEYDEEADLEYDDAPIDEAPEQENKGWAAESVDMEDVFLTDILDDASVMKVFYEGRKYSDLLAENKAPIGMLCLKSFFCSFAAPHPLSLLYIPFSLYPTPFANGIWYLPPLLDSRRHPKLGTHSVGGGHRRRRNAPEPHEAIRKRHFHL